MTGTDEAFGLILNDLLDMYPALPGLRLRLGYRRATHLAHGWYQRCHRSCEAVLGLDGLGYNAEAAPIRRTIIEHVVALRWLAAAGDNIMDTMALEHADRAKRIAKAASKAGWTSVDVDEIAAVVDEIEAESRDQSLKEWKRFLKQNEGHGDAGVLASYLAEVGRTHATFQSAIDYFDIDSNTALPESRVTVPGIKFAANYLLEATVALASTFEEPVWDEPLVDLAARSRAANDRVRVEQGLSPINWTTDPTIV